MTDTTHDLTNRMIAERLGHRVHTKAGLRRAGLSWRLSAVSDDPQDDEVIDDGPEYVRLLPDYLHDANAALTLPLPPGYRYDLRYAVGDTAACYILNEVDAVVDGTGAHGDDPADVVCRSWWALITNGGGE